MRSQLIQSIIRLIFSNQKLKFLSETLSLPNQLTKYFEYYFLRNIIRNLFSETKQKKGDNYKCLFREDTFYDDLLKFIVISFDGSFFYNTYIRPLSKLGKFNLLLKKSVFEEEHNQKLSLKKVINVNKEEEDKSDDINSILHRHSKRKGSELDLFKTQLSERLNKFHVSSKKLVPNTPIQKVNNKRNSRTLDIKNMHVKREIPIAQLDIKLFLDFYDDFTYKLHNNMPMTLRIILKIITIEAKTIFSIPDDKESYPIFIFLFFKIYCNPSFYSIFNFPDEEESKTKLIQLNKILINIASNSHFEHDDDKEMTIYNYIINCCNKKLINIFNDNIIKISEDELKESSIEYLRIINYPINQYYNDCDFVYYCCG